MQIRHLPFPLSLSPRTFLRSNLSSARNVDLGCGSIISRYEENNSRQDRVRKRINRGTNTTLRYVRGPPLPSPPLPSLDKASVGAIGDLIRLYFVLIHKYIWRESAAGTIKRLIAVQFVINKSGERPRRGVAPLRCEETGMRDFSGPGAPPARYLQRPKGRRKKCLQDDAQSTLEKASIFRVFLPPSSNLPSSLLSFIDP